MNFSKILEDLRQERDRIEAVIVTLEALSTSGRKKRGRPKGAKNKTLVTVAAAGA